MKERMAAVVKTRTRDEWCELLEGTDACFAPVLGPDEAPAHPHNRQRATFTEVAGVMQPAPAPALQPDPTRDQLVRRPGPGSTPMTPWQSWGFGSGRGGQALRAAGAVR